MTKPWMVSVMIFLSTVGGFGLSQLLNSYDDKPVMPHKKGVCTALEADYDENGCFYGTVRTYLNTPKPRPTAQSLKQFGPNCRVFNEQLDGELVTYAMDCHFPSPTPRPQPTTCWDAIKDSGGWCVIINGTPVPDADGNK